MKLSIRAPWFGVWVLAFAISAGGARGEVKVAAVFSDHAVFQRDRAVPVWGTADVGERVEVVFGAQRKEVVADAAGKWRVSLDALAANATGTELIVRGTNVVTLRDVLVGDVWLCSGQSNMERQVGERKGQKPLPDAEAEIAAANLPQMRLFKVKKQKLSVPGKDVEAAWAVCSPETLLSSEFSAVGYFFGKKIHQEVGVPVGLIDSTWGGTRIEPWTPPEAFARMPSLAAFAVAAQTPDVKADNSTPSNLYYGMIQPLAPYALHGFLWYQGESNLMDTHDRATYGDKMEALITGWRAAFGAEEAPFYYVQIAPHFYHVIRRRVHVSPTILPEFWEAQTEALRVKNTAMVGTVDLVDDLFDIHPRDKKSVGERLARVALKRTYGKSDLVDSGPVMAGWRVRDGKVVVTFGDVAGGLKSSDGKALTWFEVAGADGRFFAAEATIEGADKVIVSSPYVKQPVVVRFAWDEAAQPNLKNAEGLPAWAFRTDSGGATVRGVMEVKK
ncbi:sialate O-acetylesterase [Nibricoccus aquaticus]|uniref:Sialate O-acetylesterase n=1 Tax=Nibricoccus aquaticus TaxID=2576891 RepID=A0A290Q4X7_9BACT|nr:sialate O-acetylesterase [Nibricoccus aquaticus]ATC63483.1 sialate O-acetylesterase [Nibricoccus aquaticus]